MKVRVQMRNGRVCGSASTPLKNTMNGRSVINVFTSFLSGYRVTRGNSRYNFSVATMTLHFVKTTKLT